MLKYLVLTENFDSKWADKTGVHYHFPLWKYKNQILPGSKFIYYRGSRGLKGKRVTPTYFGIGKIGDISIDPMNPKAAYCKIIGYQPFLNPVPFVDEVGNNLEDTRGRSNYFRDGAREISLACYNRILSLAKLGEVDAAFEIRSFEIAVDEIRRKSIVSLTQAIDAGVINNVGRKQVATTIYQRSPVVAAFVLQRSSGVCERCRLPAPFMRQDGTPYLEVHHLEPLSEGGADTIENTVALCPNCHRLLHYGQNTKGERVQLRQQITIHND